MSSRFRLLLPLFLVVLLSPMLLARQAGGVNKSLFVAVLDENGRPVRQFTADDVLIREDGQDRPVVEVKPASQPISVAVLIDTAQSARVSDHYGTPDEYVRDLRVATSSFAHQLLTLSPEAHVSLMEFGQAAVTMVPYVTDDVALQGGITKLVGRPGAASVLLEAIIEAGNSLAKRPSARRAIVSLNVEPTNEQSREEPKKINESLRKSLAQLWAVSVQSPGTSLKNPTRDVVLNGLTRNSGGNREFINAPSALESVLARYADALTSQYEVTYKRPGSSAQVVQVGTLRQGLTLHASGFAPE